MKLKKLLDDLMPVCERHPKYTVDSAKRAPRADCEMCRRIWNCHQWGEKGRKAGEHLMKVLKNPETIRQFAEAEAENKAWDKALRKCGWITK